MRSILIGVKRFLTNKNTITIIAILGSLLLLYGAYNKRIEDATSPKAVVVAINEIGPRTYITNDLISVKKIPGSVIESAYASTSDVIGKYVSNDAVVPANGMFYKGMVKTWEELPRSVYGDIPDGNTVVALEVDLDKTYGNSIFPGNYIDLYYKDFDENGKIMVQKFIESIKVLAVLDSSGKNVFETNGALSAPRYLMFSVPEDLHLLLRKASYLSGEIFPVPRNAKYSSGNTKETRVVSTFIKEYILNQTIDVNAKDNNTIINSQNNSSQIDTMVVN
jgi:hypothetical protein